MVTESAERYAKEQKSLNINLSLIRKFGCIKSCDKVIAVINLSSIQQDEPSRKNEAGETRLDKQSVMTSTGKQKHKQQKEIAHR